MEPLKQILIDTESRIEAGIDEARGGSVTKISTQIALLLMGLIIFIWVMTAEMDQVITATGKVIEPRDVEMIQHLEGGIISEILIQEGERVHRGQPLARLHNIESESALLSLTVESEALRGDIAKLTALIDGSEPDFSSIESAEIAQLYRSFWEAEDLKNSSQDNSLTLQIEKDQALLVSMQDRLASSELQRSLMTQKVEIREELYKRQVSSLIELIQAQIDDMNMAREVENLREAILEKQLTISSTQQQLTRERADRLAQYMTELVDAQKKLAVNLASLPPIQDKVDRLTIYSPADGIVDNIKFNFSSAVLPPGESFAELAPLDQTILAEIEVAPNDIGHIEIGQAVRIKVSTYDFAQYGWLNGRVTSISRYSTETEQETYFTARVSLDTDFVVKDGAEYKVLPAMEVTAEIITGRRSVADYFIKPIKYLVQGVFDER
ncbi:HlyD family type I secretion periplasmic adaptor subunit [Umboniibacter marinipuniceus]|uniref:Membrane fusion protein (MFP) family protein n=1 Tax=Umboniibacter marinipuniceus TaxID=569599 RepID=A0A3M0AE03_9GAMM|nr:HlyD family type I secretion periplasmic adaptor subunit [Umboniibacter marinipuniceus]RMA82766.1 HlyD family secretion protein/adhesin transport system membrane fusion protein [Umboniibacter marinipuniceus]